VVAFFSPDLSAEGFGGERFVVGLTDLEIVGLSEAVSGIGDLKVPLNGEAFSWRTKTFGQIMITTVFPLSSLAVEDLRNEVSLTKIHRRFCSTYEQQLAGGGLGVFLPAFEIQLERQTAKMQQSLQRMRELLDSIIDRVVK
jgi:hypothetical protein